jgi:hypothetical protein
MENMGKKNITSAVEKISLQNGGGVMAVQPLNLLWRKCYNTFQEIG